MKFSPFIISLIFFLSGCAITPEQKFNRAIKKASETAFTQRPALYRNLLEKGDINQAAYDTWMQGWEKENKEIQEINRNRKIAAEKERAAHEKWLRSLTPAQRMEMARREQEMQYNAAMQQAQFEQNRQAARAAGARMVIDNMARQQEINAYNARTQALSNPQQINVNHSGAINLNHQNRNMVRPVNIYPTYGY
jgi:hypothetical protein